MTGITTMADPRDNVVDLPPRGDDPLRCGGVARVADNDPALIFVFDRRPTDAEMRFLHDVMRRAAVCARGGDDA